MREDFSWRCTGGSQHSRRRLIRGETRIANARRLKELVKAECKTSPYGKIDAKMERQRSR
jgi:hypothetical protein